MPKGLKTTAPDVTKLDRFAQLDDIMGAFADGKIPLLVIIGRPGTCKSQSLRRATDDDPYLLIKGRKSPIKFYESAYNFKDKPVVVDDANHFLSDKLNQEMLRALTESNDWKRLEWATVSKYLESNGIPEHFYTSSPVCIISNWWDESDPMLQGLESRAEFFLFEPSWPELHRHVGRWFWDKEIYSYIGDRIPTLKAPDARLYVKAYKRKQAKLKHLSWQDLVDEYADDEAGQQVRELMKLKIPNNEKARQFVEGGFGSRATYYRRLSDISNWLPGGKIPSPKLVFSKPKMMERPMDAQVVTLDEDDEIEE